MGRRLVGDSSSESSEGSSTCPLTFEMGQSSREVAHKDTTEPKKEPNEATKPDVGFPLEIRFPKHLLPDAYLVRKAVL